MQEMKSNRSSSHSLTTATKIIMLRQQLILITLHLETNETSPYLD